jgi:hypothetical protein
MPVNQSELPLSFERGRPIAFGFEEKVKAFLEKVEATKEIQSIVEFGNQLFSKIETELQEGINSQEEYEKWAMEDSRADTKFNEGEEIRKIINKPINNSHKEVQAFFKNISARIITCREIINNSMKNWVIKKKADEEKKRKELEAEQRRLAQEEKERLEKLKSETTDPDIIREIEDDIISVENTPVIMNPDPIKTTVLEDGGKIQQRWKWKAQIFNKSMLIKAVASGNFNENFLDVNLKAIENFATGKEGKVIIPGVKLYEDVGFAKYK